MTTSFRYDLNTVKTIFREYLKSVSPPSPPGDPREGLNPVRFSHARIRVGGRTFGILSRVAFAGVDHTGRTNQFAHPLMLEEDELGPGGPVAVLSRPGVMRPRWSGEPSSSALGESKLPSFHPPRLEPGSA